MSRLPMVFLGVAVACAVAAPSAPARAEGVLIAKAKKKKPAGKKKPGKKGATPTIEKGMKVVPLGDASVLDDPSDSGKTVYQASEGQVLTVVKVQKKWVRVKNADGKQGWVQAAEVVPKEVYDAKEEGGGGDEGGDEDERGEKAEKKKERKDKDRDEESARNESGGDEGGSSSVSSSDSDEDRPKKKKRHSDDDEGDEGASVELKGRARMDGKLRIGAGAQLIGLIRSQKFSSAGTNAFANYTIDVSSPGADVFARVTRKGGAWELGGEIAFLATFGNGGVTVGSGAAAETLAWSETQIDGRVLAGYHVANGFLLSARLGYRVMTINIDNSATIKQPSESLAGVAIGAEAVAYGLSPKLEVRVGVETLVAASLTQTAALKDGDNSTVSPVYLFAEGSYMLTPRLQLVGSYTLGYESYAFSGTSARDPANGNGTRNDLQHTFAGGAQFWF